MYSDEIIVVCIAQTLQSNTSITKEVCNNLLGPNAIEANKSEYRRIQIVIGYDINLDTSMYIGFWIRLRVPTIYFALGAHLKRFLVRH